MKKHLWTWKQAIFESNLQSTTKLVLAALGSHLNDMGGAMFPSQERLAKLCSLSERSVITHLDIAEKVGWIKSEVRGLEGKKWASKCYFASWPDEVKDVHPINDNGMNDVHPYGVKEFPSRGETLSKYGVKDVHTNRQYRIDNKNIPPTPKGEKTKFIKTQLEKMENHDGRDNQQHCIIENRTDGIQERGRRHNKKPDKLVAAISYSVDQSLQRNGLDGWKRPGENTGTFESNTRSNVRDIPTLETCQEGRTRPDDNKHGSCEDIIDIRLRGNAGQ